MEMVAVLCRFDGPIFISQRNFCCRMAAKGQGVAYESEETRKLFSMLKCFLCKQVSRKWQGCGHERTGARWGKICTFPYLL